MIEHLPHFLLIVAIVFITCLIRFRHLLRYSLFFVLLIIGLVFHDLFIHIDHNTYDQLSESMHQCCILPVATIVDEVWIAAVFEHYILNIEATEIISIGESIHLFYSRPPPHIS